MIDVAKLSLVTRELESGSVPDSGIHCVTDDALIAQISGGETSALAALYDRHGSVALSLAFRVLRNRALAEDAVHEAFVSLWKTAGRYDRKKSSVRTWICVLTHRRSVDLAKREARHRCAQGRAEDVPRDSYSAEEVTLLRHDQLRIRAALDRLTDEAGVILASSDESFLSAEISPKPVESIVSETGSTFARWEA